MKIDNHRLVISGNTKATYKKAGTTGGKLRGEKPRFLVIHYTAGSTGAGAVNWFARSDANSSAHLVIDHDGHITQMLDFDTVGWHAGRSSWKNVKGLNSHSVGIEIANWGLLSKSGADNWVSYTGKTVPNDRVIVAGHKHSADVMRGWESFDEAQYTASVHAARAIVEHYGISADDLVGHEDISPTRKVDPGPAFDMARFKALVYGREEDDWDHLSYVVRSASGLNLRQGPTLDADIITLLADGTQVHVIERTGIWWLVSQIVDGNEDKTGFVHSHWLRPA